MGINTFIAGIILAMVAFATYMLGMYMFYRLIKMGPSPLIGVEVYVWLNGSKITYHLANNQTASIAADYHVLLSGAKHPAAQYLVAVLGLLTIASIVLGLVGLVMVAIGVVLKHALGRRD